MAFAVLYLGAALKLHCLWAGVCLVGAVYFNFRCSGYTGSAPGPVGHAVRGPEAEAEVTLTCGLWLVRPK